MNEIDGNNLNNVKDGKIENGFSESNKENYGNCWNSVMIYSYKLRKETNVIRRVQLIWIIDIVGTTETVEKKKSNWNGWNNWSYWNKLIKWNSWYNW